MIRIGTAGWGISARHAARLPGNGTHLERYAQVLPAVEINTSYYRHHRAQTYARWAASVPATFRFSVKTPRALTPPGGLSVDQAVLDQFAAEVSGLGAKLGVLLVQFAPRVEFEEADARVLFASLRASLSTPIACEPRHASWAAEPADACMRDLGIARVAADPPRWVGGDSPGGSAACAYFRLHGAPRTYYSDYDAEHLATLAGELERRARVCSQVWCILDNTALGHALGNALEVQRRLAG